MQRGVERLSRHIAKVCNLERFGGKTCVSKNDTVVLFDYDEWNDSMQDKIKMKFPGVTITCANDRTSATGLVVVFVLQDTDHRAGYLLWHLLVNLVLAFAVYHALVRRVCHCGCSSLHSNLLLCNRV